MKDPNPPMTPDEIAQLKERGYSWDNEGNMVRPDYASNGDRSSRATTDECDDGLRLRRASGVEPEPVSWAWEGRLPLGAVSLLVGLPSFGKTVIAGELTARVTRGQLAGDLHDEPSSVLFATAEDSLANTLVPRMTAAGADLDLVEFVTMRREGIEDGLLLPDDVEALEHAVIDRCARLVVIDPLMAHVGSTVDSHRDHHIRRVLAPLARLAEATRAAVLVLAHLNKAVGGDLFTRVGGSIGLTAAARSVLLAAADPEDPETSRLLAHGKSNLGPHASTLRYRIEARTIGDGITTAGLAWNGEADVSIDDLLAGPARQRPTPKTDAAKEMLLEKLSTGPVLVETLRFEARRRGVGWRTVKDVKSDLGVISEQEHEPGRHGAGPTSWRLPDDE